MYFLLSSLLLLFPCSLYGQLLVLFLDFLLSDCLLFSLWSIHCSHYCTMDSCSQSRMHLACINTLLVTLWYSSSLFSLDYQLWSLHSCVHLTLVWLPSPCTLYVSIVLTSSEDMKIGEEDGSTFWWAVQSILVNDNWTCKFCWVCQAIREITLQSERK